MPRMPLDAGSPVARSEIRFGDGEEIRLPTTGSIGNVWKRDTMSNNLQSQVLQGAPHENPHYYWIRDDDPMEVTSLFEPTGVPEVDALAQVLDNNAALALEDNDAEVVDLLQTHLDQIAEAVMSVTRREVEKVKREAADELARMKIQTTREVVKAREDTMVDLIMMHSTEMRTHQMSEIITATIMDVPLTPALVERVRNRITGIGT